MDVLFIVRPERGHVNPTLPVAEALRTRGHHVRYVAFNPLVAEVVSPRGFDVVSCNLALSPARYQPGDMLPGFDAIGARLWWIESFLIQRKAVLDALPSCLQGLGSSVVFTDVNQPAYSLVVQELGWPQVTLHPSIPWIRDPLQPSPRAFLLPGTDDASRRRVDANWSVVLADMRRKEREVAELQRQALLPDAPFTSDALRAAFEARGYRGALASSVVCFWIPILDGYPHVVTVPKAFDFPREHELFRFIGNEVVFGSAAPVPDDAWARALAQDVECRVLVCLGTQAARYDQTKVLAIKRAAINAVGDRPGCQLVIQLSNEEKQHFSPLPANVVADGFVPQRSILARTDVFVTHCGASSMFEAIAEGVPMLMCPMDVDQPGNAARGVYHKLGEVLPHPITAESLWEAIARARQPAARARVRELASRCRATEELDALCDLVGAMDGPGDRAAPPDLGAAVQSEGSYAQRSTSRQRLRDRRQSKKVE